jgi:hypothetical protein
MKLTEAAPNGVAESQSRHNCQASQAGAEREELRSEEARMFACPAGCRCGSIRRDRNARRSKA